MPSTYHHLYLARVQIEAKTPLAIHTGQAELNYDTALVRDANGLPALPATSIRGVLRHICRQQLGTEATWGIFGYGQQESGSKDDEQASRLQVGWGAVHGQHNQPITGRVTQRDIQADLVLDELQQSQPIKRERVRLNHQGSAVDAGKFDVTAAPKGTRFSFELKYWSDHGNDSNWQALLNLLGHPGFRLGSNTRSGFGAIEVLHIHQAYFDLTQPEDIEAWQALSRDLHDTQGLSEAVAETASAAVSAELQLQAEGFLRIGGGGVSLLDDNNAPADLLPQSEKCLTWRNGQASWSQRLPLIPASAIKGALAHRISYHQNRLLGKFADQLSSAEHAEAVTRQADDPITGLLGYASDDGEDTQGLAGQMLMDDVYLSADTQAGKLWHNKIDRFTGGVIDGALFNQEALFQPCFTLTLTLLKPEGINPIARDALQAALDDLCNGRLALGADGARSLGSCTGTLNWSDNGQWLEQQECA